MKEVVGDACVELWCPIALALSVYPVIAEDGFIYERSAVKALTIRQAMAAEALEALTPIQAARAVRAAMAPVSVRVATAVKAIKNNIGRSNLINMKNEENATSNNNISKF